MFSIITIASSTTKPVAMVSAISDRLFRLKPEQVHHAERADQRQRHGDAGDERWPETCAGTGRSPAPPAPTVSISSNCTSCTEARMVVGAVGEHRDVDRRGQRGLQLRQQRLDAVDDLDDVGAGLALDVQDHRRACRSSRPPAARSRRRRSTSATSASVHRRAVAVGDDQRPVVPARQQLVVGADDRGLARPVEAALGLVDVGGRHRARAGPRA